MGSTKAKRVLSIVVYCLLISSVFIVAGCKKKKTSDVTGMIPKIRIVYNSNGADGGAAVPTDSNTYAATDTIRIAAVPVFTKSSGQRTLNRTHWSTASSGGTNVPAGADLSDALRATLFTTTVLTPNRTLTLYAKWS